jgi:hypothetical protein
MLLPIAVSPAPEAPWQDAHFALNTSAPESAANVALERNANASRIMHAWISLFIDSSPCINFRRKAGEHTHSHTFNAIATPQLETCKSVTFNAIPICQSTLY